MLLGDKKKCQENVWQCARSMSVCWHWCEMSHSAVNEFKWQPACGCVGKRLETKWDFLRDIQEQQIEPCILTVRRTSVSSTQVYLDVVKHITKEVVKSQVKSTTPYFAYVWFPHWKGCQVWSNFISFWLKTIIYLLEIDLLFSFKVSLMYNLTVILAKEWEPGVPGEVF